MQNLVNLKPRTTSPTNTDFFNLFRPLVPHFHTTGITAQIISGTTEAITIWRITQSELSNINKWMAIVASIIAVVLIVTILEYGGRKFLQVLTRVLIWQRFKGIWYVTLFTIVTLVTISIIYFSFTLSTNGIHTTFTSSVPEYSFNYKPYEEQRMASIDKMEQRMEAERMELEATYQRIKKATIDTYVTKVTEVTMKEKDFLRKHLNGQKWAKSHANKWRNKATELETKSAAAIAILEEEHATTLSNFRKRKEASTKAEEERHMAIITDAKNKATVSHKRKETKAGFWGGLLGSIVGFCVLLAYVCIITEEVFRRGSGIKTEYKEEERPPYLLPLLWKGISGHLDKFFRKRIETFVQIGTPPNFAPIGFKSPPTAIPSNEIKNAVAPPLQPLTVDQTNISDKEILKLAHKAAKSYAQAYDNKPETKNTLEKRKRWWNTANSLKQLI